MLGELEDNGKAGEYAAIANRIKKEITDKFYDESGWLLSATGLCRQKDVWGTAFAMYIDILEEPYKRKTAEALAEGFKNGTAVDNGYVRHILAGEDALEDSAWERTFCSYNTYQNGGYWSTPSGWYIYALAKYFSDLAVEMLENFVHHTRENEDKEAPFEWRTTDDLMYEGRQYGVSAALPYAALIRLVKEKKPCLHSQ